MQSQQNRTAKLVQLNPHLSTPWEPVFGIEAAFASRLSGSLHFCLCQRGNSWNFGGGSFHRYYRCAGALCWRLALDRVPSASRKLPVQRSTEPRPSLQ